MNCNEFAEIVCDLAREQLIDVSVRSRAVGHSHECEQCAMRLEDETAITIKLRKFATKFQSLGARPGVETALLEEFAAQTTALTVPAITRTHRWLSYGTAAAAALVLIFFAVAMFRPRQAPALTGGPKEGLVVSAVSFPHSPAGVAPSPKPILPRPKRSRAISANKETRPAASNEIVTDFIPVTPGGIANLTDGGRMVRVEMPRSAMASFGLPVNMDRADEKVKADVLVGVDGLAHAIRFVR